MSWARLGAKTTGVDFSDVAIERARSLNDECGLAARFICSNVYELPQVLNEEFDIVFTSYGVLAWLPDIERWARVVDNHLRPGGVFYIADHHPFMAIFEPSESGDMLPTNGYFHEEMFFEGNQPSYAGSQPIASTAYEWQHSLGEVVTALTGAGLRIEFLHEFPFCDYRAFPIMEQGDDGWWRFPKNNGSIPQMFSIKATK